MNRLSDRDRTFKADLSHQKIRRSPCSIPLENCACIVVSNQIRISELSCAHQEAYGSEALPE